MSPSARSIPYGSQWIGEDDILELTETLSGDFLTTGCKVEQFEEALHGQVGAKYSIAVNSDTSALDIAVAALELSVES